MFLELNSPAKVVEIFPLKQNHSVANPVGEEKKGEGRNVTLLDCVIRTIQD